MNEVISSSNISFRYPHASEAFLKDIDLNVFAGECILICGESGSGKSTFSRLLNGISPNYIEGELNGQLQTLNLTAGETDINEYVPVVGSVFQNPKTQHFTTNSTAELAFPLENTGLDSSTIQEKIDEKAAAFQIEHLLDRNIFELSGGEKQQLAFVSANMLEPSVLILDEVTSNLDQQAIDRIREMVIYLKKQGVTVIIFEHRLAWTRDLVDRYFLFENGKVIEEWDSAEFQKLSNDELHRLSLRSMDLSEYKELIQEKTNTFNLSTKATLQTKNLSVGYSNRKILHDLNLNFQDGEIIGLMGPNGTGKSTLANTLTGLQQPVAGDILWRGEKVTSKQLLEKSYLVMQDMNYQLFTDSVTEEITLGGEYATNHEELIEQLNLAAYKDRHPQSLSEGQKQRVAIASALASNNEIIIFDEPTSGLDYKHMEKFGRLLEDLKKTETIVIVITHDEELAATWCDSIINLV